MDHQAFAQLLGNYGEFVGAIVVMFTLVYLTIQVRQNNKALEENRKLALAQTYQARAALYVEVIMKGGEANVALAGRKYRQARKEKDAQTAIGSLSPEERSAYASFLNAMRTCTDNAFYQYELGLLDEEYKDWAIPGQVNVYGSQWKDWNVPLGRRSFAEEVDRILKA